MPLAWFACCTSSPAARALILLLAAGGALVQEVNIDRLVSPAPATAPLLSPATAAPAAHSEPLTAQRWHQQHDLFYERKWGIRILGVRAVSSGWMLQWKYQVLDANRAAPLLEKRSRAYVIDEATDTRLAVPAMENIGELRQTPRPEEGRVYYMIFGNPNKLVPKGGRVDVVIGNFRADGLLVE